MIPDRFNPLYCINPLLISVRIPVPNVIVSSFLTIGTSGIEVIFIIMSTGIGVDILITPGVIEALARELSGPAGFSGIFRQCPETLIAGGIGSHLDFVHA